MNAILPDPIAKNSGADRHARSSEPAPIAKPSDPGRPGYFGSKAGCGVWQRIINQIPPHYQFIEAFAGMAPITRRKKPAASTIVIDSDPAVAELLSSEVAGRACTVVCGDAVSWLEKNRKGFDHHTVIYLDPPYLYDTRSSRRKRYGHEFSEEWLHGELLAVLTRVTCQEVKVLISGYRHTLYDRMLPNWRRIDYTAMTHGGPRVESLWCNFDQPAELHDYSQAGDGFRERERLKRKKARWIERLRAMPDRDRAVLLAAIDDYRRSPTPEPARVATG